MKFKLLTFIAVLAASAAALTAFNSCNAQEKKGKYHAKRQKKF